MNDAMFAGALAMLAPALAEMLVRFVWEGAAIGVLAWTALALLRDARPQARYAVACFALLSCVLVPAMGLLQWLVAGDAPAAVHIDLPLQAGAAASVVFDAGSDALPFALPGIASPWIVTAWAAGVAALSLRMACGLLWVGRLRRAAGADADGKWQSRVDALAARLGIARRVALRLMPGDGTPLTAGWLRPVVLLPVAVAARMPVDLVEALLAHELAHVRRHDYLVNVLQGAVEALLFYHPVVWWLSHRIRVERELVADDLAATALGDRRRLALALSELDRCIPDRSGALPSRLAPAAHGGQLMPRIQHLIRPQRRSTGALLALPLVGLALAGAAFYAQAHLATAQEDTATAAAPASPVAPATPVASAAPAASAASAVAALPAPAAAPEAPAPPPSVPAPLAVPAPAPLPVPAAAPGKPVLRTPAPDERSSYAFVRKGEDGISMSGNLDDVDDIDVARDRIDGDFLWFRRDGRAWVIRDRDTIARARQAWAGTENIEKEMHALEAQMKPHEAKLKALGERMQSLGEDNAMDSPDARATLKNVEALSTRMQALAGRQMALAQRVRRAGSDRERERLDIDQEQLDRQQEALDAEMEKHNATMEALSARMAEQAAPREALAREMEAASAPMQDIGERMQGVGERIERAAHVADRQVRTLIDQAYRDGRAEPAPVLR
jgi:beta-lactamase regulating signal transducer with metallopeptidase domain/predicted  nucleic acid-binding Zn-ribbon protein